MKLFKLVFTIIILALAGVFIYENILTLTQELSFKLDLYFLKTPPDQLLKLYYVILISAFAGFIIGLGFMLKPYFKTRRQLKRERLEKKQAQEELNLRQTKPEPQLEAAVPSAQTDLPVEG